MATTKPAKPVEKTEVDNTEVDNSELEALKKELEELKALKAPKAERIYVIKDEEQKEAEKNFEQRKLWTKAELAKQPKVPVFVPREETDHKDACLSVTVNGYRFQIRKGSMVEVPESIANIVKKRIEGVDFDSLLGKIPTMGLGKVKDYTGQAFERTN